jgi:hypothetical protein
MGAFDMVGDCIDLLDPQEVEVIRFLPPPVVDGRVVGDPEEERFPATGSLQALSQKDLLSLPEGLRNQGTVKFYTQCELRTVELSENRIPDQFVAGGVTYEVKTIDDWRPAGDYFKVIATRVDR